MCESNMIYCYPGCSHSVNPSTFCRYRYVCHCLLLLHNLVYYLAALINCKNSQCAFNLLSGFGWAKIVVIIIIIKQFAYYYVLTLMESCQRKIAQGKERWKHLNAWVINLNLDLRTPKRLSPGKQRRWIYLPQSLELF